MGSESGKPAAANEAVTLERAGRDYARAVAADFAVAENETSKDLAARVDPPKGNDEREEMRTLHLDGTRNVIRAAKRAGVQKLVLASSAVVYGARPENPIPLDETAPVRPNEDFPYAVDKAGQERIVENERGASLRIAIARPAIVYGRGARNYLTEIIRRSPVLPALDGRRPFLLVGTREHDQKISPDFTEVQRLGSIIIPVFTGELRRFYLDRLDGFKGYQP